VYEIAAVILFVVTLGITGVRGALRAATPFVGPHAFVSADVATTARTFAVQGIVHLRGVPVNNNPPLGPADGYTHWPPLLPMLLSVAFRFFGVSERTSHLLMLAVLLTTAFLIFRLGTTWLGLVGGALAGYFWLTLPVVVQYGDLVAQQSLCMMFVIASFVAAPKRPKLAALLLFVAVFSAWEAALVAPALWLVSLRVPSLRRTACLAGLATVASIAFIVALYLFGDPQSAIDTLAAAKFYMGLSRTYSHIDRSAWQVQLPLIEQLRLTMLNNVWMLGPLGLAALLQFAMVRPRTLSPMLLPLAAPWLIWCIVMHNHTARHHFEFLIGAPAAAIALAWLASHTQIQLPVRGGILAAVAALQLLLLPAPHVSDGYDPVKLIHFAEEIRAATPPQSVVLSPLTSAVPLYYSQRHIIRNISSPAAVAAILPELRAQFPAAPVFLALPPALESEFDRMPHLSAPIRSPDAIIVKLGAPDTK
jgi:hypothetical protein